VTAQKIIYWEISEGIRIHPGNFDDRPKRDRLRGSSGSALLDVLVIEPASAVRELRSMSKVNVVWCAVAGVLLSLLVGVAGTLLAIGDGNSPTGAVIVGAGAAGGVLALWIAGSVAVHTMLRGE
jgi:hypothetical protein